MRPEPNGSRRFSVLGPQAAQDAVTRGCDLDPRHLAENCVVGFEQLSERAHPFIALRAHLLKHARETGQHIFAVTSVQPGNGKTHVAVNLAAALSRITPTLLIELDLRRPSIGARLGLPRPSLGVDDFLGGKAQQTEIGVRVHGYDLCVYPSRIAHDSAEELIGSPRLAALLKAARTTDNPSICIIDTPPVVIDDDFSRITPAIDGVLMVVEEGRTPSGALRDALRQIQPTPVVGTILNNSITGGSTGIDYGYYRGETPGSNWLDRTRAAFGRHPA